MLHDSLVEVWDKPQQEIGDGRETLQQKADIWDRYRRSVPPRSSPREQTATPGV